MSVLHRDNEGRIWIRIRAHEEQLAAKDAEIKQLGAELQKMERAHVSELAAKNREIAALKAEVERLRVQFGRGPHLLTARNGSQALCGGKGVCPACERDTELTTLREQVSRLSAPVSDEEWMEGKLTVVYPYPDHDSTRECMLRPVIDRMIAARLEGK